MKALIHCPAQGVEWVGEYFPGLEPYLLRLGNKPFLEYLIDFCVLNGIQTVKIVTDEPPLGLENELGNGERWGIELSYGSCAPAVRPLELPSRHAKALGDDALLLLSGMFWLHYNCRDFRRVTAAEGTVRRIASGMFLIGGNCDWSALAAVEPAAGEWPGVRVEALASLEDFYNRSMALAHGEAVNYAMPSYNNTPDVYIGQNVSISRTAEVNPPVILGSIVQIGEDTQIGPGTIIGDNSFIDDDTTVAEAVIMGNSYVGCHLEILNKIVYRNMIINPRTGLKLDIIDDFVLTSIEDESVRPRVSHLQRLLALLTWMIWIPLWLSLRPWLRIRWKLVECYLSADRKRSIRLKLYIYPGDSMASRWFRRLSLDRFHLLGLAIRGDLRLVGSKIMAVNPENERRLHQFPDYVPGLFSYSEMLGHENDSLQVEMDELYYIYHASFALNWEILRRSLLRNLLKER